MAKTGYQTIDDYIAAFPEEDRVVLLGIRAAIREGAPEAEEAISYQVPAFKFHGFVMYFSAYAKHYSLSFPPPWTVFEQFKEDLAPYKISKSTVQLPKDRPIPYELIAKMAAFRARENEAAMAT